MSFSRKSPEPRPLADELTARMVGIGMNFAAKPRPDADLEATLVHASSLGMVDGDLRVLSVLTTWLGVHHAHVNADRLVRLSAAETSERVRAYWAAIATWLAKDRRFARLNTRRARVRSFVCTDAAPFFTSFSSRECLEVRPEQLGRAHGLRCCGKGVQGVPSAAFRWPVRTTEEVAKRSERDLEADVPSVTEAVNDGLRRRGPSDWHALDHPHVDAVLQRETARPNELDLGR